MLVQGSFNTLNVLDLFTFPAAIAYLLFVWSFIGARAGLGLRIALGLTTLEYLAQIMLLRDIITPVSSNLASSILTLLIALLVFALLLRSAACGNRDAALLLVPFLLASLGQAGEGLRSVFCELGWIPVTREFNIYAGYGFAVTYAQFGTLLSYLAIGAVLVVRFTRSAREQQRMASELDSARQVQAQLVPESLPTLPHLHIEAAYRAAAEVGGDFYQVVSQADGAALIVLGDVSGKGLKAAMTGALAIGALRALAADDPEPAKFLVRLNRQVCAAQNGGFITCLCLRISRNGQVVLANAGHLAPYRSGSEVELPPGLPP
jgi:Stage II sporulation protein E (SpoIIE)